MLECVVFRGSSYAVMIAGHISIFWIKLMGFGMPPTYIVTLLDKF